MTVWMARAGRQGEDEQLALAEGVIVVGWDAVPSLSSVQTKEQLRELLEGTYPEDSKAKISNSLGQLWAFKERMQVGDIVVLPLKTRSAIAIGRVQGPYVYAPDNPEGARHTRKVEWIRKDVQRDEFGQDLLYSFGAFMTVCQISRNNAEARVLAVLEGKQDPHISGTGQTLQSAAEAQDDPDSPPQDLELYSLDLIRKHISARFKGHELTRLVTSILKAQGFHAYMSPPGPDGGADIIAGRGAMGFDSPRLCIQVKSGSTPVDVTSLRELQGVMKNFGAEQGLFVSWSGFKETVYKEARTLFFEIRLWDSDKLIQALLENYESISDVLQAEIPLKRIWTLVPEEQ